MAATSALPAEITEIPGDVQRRIDKGRTGHRKWLAGWAENLAFVEGRQFVFKAKASSGTTLSELETREWGDKDPNRARTVRNRVMGFWLSEVSMGTQRVPGYEVAPENNDPEIINAARLSEKVLFYLYDYLRVRKYLVETYEYAVACGEGFIRPYWDPSKGDPLPPAPIDPMLPLEEQVQEQLYTGELCLQSYGPHEVFWEEGLTFDKSPYHCIDQAMTVAQAQALPGYMGGDLKPDTHGTGTFIASQLSRNAASGDTVQVTEYLERPTPDMPEGRRFFCANGRRITPIETYPMVVRGPEGVEPCLLKLPYIPTPWRDRDMGLVEHLVDPQRTINDCVNKGIEHKNLHFHPKWLAPEGSMTESRMSTTAGEVHFYRATGGNKPEPVVPPPIPDALFKMAEQAVADMEEIASQRSIPSQIDSSKALSTFVERDNMRRAFVVQALADFHSRLGKHLLAYVQKYWSEPRMVAVQGDHATDYIPGFRGADLRDQLSVRVLPGSVEPMTRQAIEQRIMNYADHGWITPEAAMLAIQNGTAEGLIEGFEANVAKANRAIQSIIAVGNGAPGAAIPDALPFQNHQVALDVLHNWMLSAEFERMPPAVQEIATILEQQHQQLMAQAQAQAVEAQNAQAAQLGMKNAAAPQVKGMPSQPKPE